LGSSDIRIAEYGAKLFLEGWAPLIIFSGTGFGHKDDLLSTSWIKFGQAEADVFAQRARELGVPADKILIENKSENTGQNIEFSRLFLQDKKINPRQIILVQKPYMERRAFTAFKKIWLEPELIVTSPQIDFEKYSTDELPEDKIIHLMVGDLQRIKMYPEKGFQIPQDIPADVWEAYEKLVAEGFTKHLIQ
jgi:uncharacterized SAM-binding protein YcdF (DUF218 family)